MNRLKATFVLFLSVIYLTAQVPKKLLVEHFTNTNCSICASKNPSFYSNLNKQANTIYLSIHPSSPYASCLLSKQNKVANDERTNYYDVYGATPVVVINGLEVLGNIGSSNIYTPFKDATSPVSIKIKQRKFGIDSIEAKVIIKNQIGHSLDNVSIFVALAEDTVNYKGTNGEPIHYNVMRKSLTKAIGDAITLSKKSGDSTILTYTSKANAIWDFSKIFTIAALQDINTKSVIQSETVGPQINNIASHFDETINDVYPVVFPNPVHNFLSIKNISTLENKEATIFNSIGINCGTVTIDNESFSADVSSLNSGLHYLIFKTSKGLQSILFIKI